MKVHVLTAYPSGPSNPNNFQASWVRESAALDPHRKYELTDDPSQAGIILFVENHPAQDPLFLRVARHPVWKKHRQKCFLYHDSDYAYPFLSGIYPSLLRSHLRASRCAGATYVGRIERNEGVRYEPLTDNPAYLFSFMGSVNSAVRERICALSDPRAVIRDTSGQNLWSLSYEERKRYTETYGDVLRDSRFVLCPRGLGPSSYRLFETMEAGRVPVILADQWVEPPGPSWSEFSVKIPEKDVSSIPEILARRQQDAAQMSSAARAAWEKWFSKPVVFHHLVETCRAIIEARAKTNFLSESVYSIRLLGTNRRLFLRLLKRSIKG